MKEKDLQFFDNDKEIYKWLCKNGRWGTSWRYSASPNKALPCIITIMNSELEIALHLTWGHRIGNSVRNKYGHHERYTNAEIYGR